LRVPNPLYVRVRGYRYRGVSVVYF
jgi:hypothetical protein